MRVVKTVQLLELAVVVEAARDTLAIHLQIALFIMVALVVLAFLIALQDQLHIMVAVVVVVTVLTAVMVQEELAVAVQAKVRMGPLILAVAVVEGIQVLVPQVVAVPVSLSSPTLPVVALQLLVVL